MTALRLGSLFDGIGVFPLAAVRCGIEPVEVPLILAGKGSTA